MCLSALWKRISTQRKYYNHVRCIHANSWILVHVLDLLISFSFYWTLYPKILKYSQLIHITYKSFWVIVFNRLLDSKIYLLYLILIFVVVLFSTRKTYVVFTGKAWYCAHVFDWGNNQYFIANKKIIFILIKYLTIFYEII